MRIWLYAVAIILLIFGASDLRAAKQPQIQHHKFPIPAVEHLAG